MHPAEVKSEHSRPSGLIAPHRLPWGSHLCHFYYDADDVRSILVPYFRAGLEQGEQCFWVVSEVIGVEAARASLTRAIPDLEERERRGQMELMGAVEYYGAARTMSPESLLRSLLDRIARARAMGFMGLRISGDHGPVGEDSSFHARTEDVTHDACLGQHVIALCGYSLERLSLGELARIMKQHDLAILQRQGRSEVIRSITELIAAMEGDDDVSWSGVEEMLAQGGTSRPPRTAGRQQEARDLADTLRRLARLQSVTSALSEARTMTEVQEVIEEQLGPSVDASHVSILEPWVFGRSPTLSTWDEHSTWLNDVEEMQAILPSLAKSARALACVPLHAGGRTLGVMAFAFNDEQPFDSVQRAFIEDNARQAALAMARAWRYEEAERQRQRAESANRAKDEFMAVLGHELRNPLAAIRTATELLKLDDKQPTLRRTQAVLERQTSHMSKLLDGLLDASRVAQGKIALERHTLNLVDVLRQTVNDRFPPRSHPGVELSVSFSEKPLWVYGDAVRLAQVVDNVVANAFKFTEPPGEVIMRVMEEDGDAVISVEDTGRGMSLELMQNIFEPFQQGGHDLPHPVRGLGLGLTVVKRLVMLHGGTVSAHSQGEGQGSQFVIRLPLTTAPHDDVIERPVAVSPLRFLIVEDNEDAADVLRALLQASGHTVTAVYNGPSALTAMQEFQPDVVLCDIGLPGSMSGYDVARAIRAIHGPESPCLVAVSGYGSVQDMERAREAGFDHHLTKPIDLKSIDDVLRRPRVRSSS